MYVPLVFGAITFITIFLFYRANPSRSSLFVIFSWLIFQGILAYSGFYEDTSTTPPKFALTAVPTIFFIIFLFASPSGKRFINGLDESKLTFLHTIRVVVEIVLLWLFLAGAIPEVMTFEGRNFDILAGLTAPAVYYFGYIKKKLSKTVLLIWNFACLVLLLNVVVHAILAVPSNFQQIAFDQPNLAVLHFPYVWLPSVVVPIVLFSHLVCIGKLLRQSNS